MKLFLDKYKSPKIYVVYKDGSEVYDQSHLSNCLRFIAKECQTVMAKITQDFAIANGYSIKQK